MQALALVLAFGWIALAGCAGGAAYMDEAAPAATEVRTVLVVPMNFDATPPVHLVEGVERLEGAITAYLATGGREVARAGLPEVMREWGSIAPASGLASEEGALREEQLESARDQLVQRLLAWHPVDAVAMPTLLIREGWFSGNALRWDGAYRPVSIKYERGSLMEVQRISGKGHGTSLRMVLYGRDGSKFFDRYAGLEPILRYTMGGFGSTRGGRIESYTRDDLFQDPAILEEAVALSFSPWIAPSEEPD